VRGGSASHKNGIRTPPMVPVDCIGAGAGGEELAVHRTLDRIEAGGHGEHLLAGDRRGYTHPQISSCEHAASKLA